MIISFSIKNWMSFREKNTFSMIATRERQHGERLPKVKKYHLRLLPIGVIYGGNASGKTNLFKALSFARNLITIGTLPERYINVEGFRLDKESLNTPTSFSFVLLIDENIYEYEFSLTFKKIIEEKLIKIVSTSEKTLFHRKNDEIEFNPSIEEDIFFQNIKITFTGTRDNQLFLTNSVSQKIDTFAPVYNWFANSLELIAPDSRFEPFERFVDVNSPLYGKLNDILPKLDTGIENIGVEDIPFDNLPIQDSHKIKIMEDLKENMAVRLRNEQNNERYIIKRKSDKLIAEKLFTIHKDKDGNEQKFNMSNESDGTRRIFDLLPAFLEVAEPYSNKVFVIDEVERSLHSLLTRQLIEQYLSCCSQETRSQILMTTHDTLLMDQKLLRRDEMWVTERNTSGESTLYSFSEYNDVRYDKDIRKSYLQGRLGGVPRIFLNEVFVPCTGETVKGGK